MPKTARRASGTALRFGLLLGALAAVAILAAGMVRYSVTDRGAASEGAALTATVTLLLLTLGTAAMSARRVRDDLADYRRAHEGAGAVAGSLVRGSALTGMAVRGISRGSADLVDNLAWVLCSVFALATVGWAVEVTTIPAVAIWIGAALLGLLAGFTVAARVAAWSGQRLRVRDARGTGVLIPAVLFGAAMAAGLYLLGSTFGQTEWPTVLSAGVLGASVGALAVGTRAARASDRRRAAARGSVAAALSVPEGALDSDGDIRWNVGRDGAISVQPGPAAVAKASGDLDSLETRVASVMPSHEVDRAASAPGFGIRLVPVTTETLESRRLATETGGLAVAVTRVADEEGAPLGREVWKLAPGTRGSREVDLQQHAHAHGQDLLAFDPERLRAEFGRLDETTRGTRTRLAGLLNCVPHSLSLAANSEDGSLRTVAVTRAPVIPDPGKRRDMWLNAITTLAPAPDGSRWVFAEDQGLGHILLSLERDPLREVRDYDWAIEPSYKAIPFGVDEQGASVSLGLLEVNHLVGGTPGGGKSGGVTALLCGIARLKHVAIVGLDPKRVEQAMWAPRFSRIAKDPDDASEVLGAIVDEMDRRYRWMEEQGIKKLSPGVLSPAMPLVVLVIDELADLVSVGATKEEKAADAERSTRIRRIIALGRAAGIVVIAATQKPQSDVVPTSLRDLIQLRVAYATTNPAMTETILGAGMAQVGGLSHEISAAERGVCYVVPETSRTPRRMRTYWVPDEEVAEIAERYAGMRVELPWLPASRPTRPRVRREGEIIEPARSRSTEPEVVVEEVEDVSLDDLGLDFTFEEEPVAETPAPESEQVETEPDEDDDDNLIELDASFLTRPARKPKPKKVALDDPWGLVD